MLNTAEKIPTTRDTATETEVMIKKRDGNSVPFDRYRIYKAIDKAFRAEFAHTKEQPNESELANELRKITNDVVQDGLLLIQGGYIDVEAIQDLVERKLMHYGHYAVARRYIVYREDRAKARALREKNLNAPELIIVKQDGSHAPLSWEEIHQDLIQATLGLDSCSAEPLLEEISHSLYNQITEQEIDQAKILSARARIEKEPEYNAVAVRLLLNVLYKEVFGEKRSALNYRKLCHQNFASMLSLGIENDLVSKDLLSYDLERIAAALIPERDLLFQYMGLQTVYDRYLLHVSKRRIETPQYFFMRVAMGLALGEKDKEARAIEFYELLSSFRFMSSTPTLFNAGTLHPQLSSCYLSTIDDDLLHIFKVVQDNAMLSKWAGGIGNDWTNVRATGARIKGTNGESQGVVPFLKVANDTAIAVNQGGKRKGAVCAYLETWHLEIEEFLELRKNTGDDRRRTHDMHTANWIPDLFMKRVKENGMWTLFSPNDVPDLHHIYGQVFEKQYAEYEKKAIAGEIKLFKQIPAQELWRKMLSMVFETGHPWITFKDPSNIRSPQDHVGVVHNSNLCTEILLNTSAEETAVCNLGSINLAAHVTDSTIDTALLEKTITTAVRMLDNVIDINYYPTIEAKNSNLRHRPVGLGLMGFQDALYKRGISYASQAAVEFADESMELISYYAIIASTKLAKERGAYPTFPGSKWDRGILPIDSIDLLEKERGGFVDVDRSAKRDWNVARQAIKENGMRNSNVMAIAPTATIANITGVTQSIEPTFRNLFVKSNLSGEFTVINNFLVEDLKMRNLWDQEMIDDLKYFDGQLHEIERIPNELKDLYLTAVDIEPVWLIECASRRQKWIDMGQSLNLYISRPSGKQLDMMYTMAWEKGLKTTYYLRSIGATQIEKSSIDINNRGIQPRWMKNRSASSDVVIQRNEVEETEKPKVCDMSDPDCEACQ
jgi:ribonucleoside-diphosphate reductase alpha chain